MGNNCPMADDYRIGQWTPSTKVVVSNNTVYNAGGDGIVVTASQGQMITGNVVHDTHQDGDSSAGIWSEDSYGAIIADNEVYNVLYKKGGYNDAEAFDTDRCDIGATFEYNYSHKNEGGFLLTIPFSADTIVRYNISQNDGTNSGEPRYFLMNTTVDGLQIYDNGIYIDPGPNPNAGLVENSTIAYKPPQVQPIFENNLDQNSPCSINTQGSNAWFIDRNDIDVTGSLCSQNDPIAGNPEFTSPPAGIGRASATTAYTLIQGVPAPSPAFCQGASISNNGGSDFADVPLPAGVVDAGALEKGADIC